MIFDILPNTLLLRHDVPNSSATALSAVARASLVGATASLADDGGVVPSDFEKQAAFRATKKPRQAAVKKMELARLRFKHADLLQQAAALEIEIDLLENSAIVEQQTGEFQEVVKPVEKVYPPAAKTPAPVEKVYPPAAKTPAPVEKVYPPAAKTPAPVEKVYPPAAKTPAPVEKVVTPSAAVAGVDYIVPWNTTGTGRVFTDAEICDTAREFLGEYTPEERAQANFEWVIPGLAPAPVIQPDAAGNVTLADGRVVSARGLFVVDFAKRRNRFAQATFRTLPEGSDNGRQDRRTAILISRAPRDTYDALNDFTQNFINEWHGKIMTPKELLDFRKDNQGLTPEELGQCYAEGFAQENYQSYLDHKAYDEAMAKIAAKKAGKQPQKEEMDPRLAAILQRQRERGRVTSSFISKDEIPYLVRDHQVHRVLLALIVSYTYYHYPVTMYWTAFVILSWIVYICVSRYRKYMEWINREEFVYAKFLSWYSEEYQRDLHERMRARVLRRRNNRGPSAKTK